MQQVKSTSKVLPFDDVVGHEISVYSLHGEFAEYVGFETFDDEANMMVQTLVHWTKYTMYCVRKWPGAGSIPFVITNKGNRLHTTALSVATWSEKEYIERPELLKRAPFKIIGLCSKIPLIEIEGAAKYAGSKREEADRELFLSCPWERDNKKFHEQFAK